jgi:CxxC-x17-CxxC domain-containing protein
MSIAERTSPDPRRRSAPRSRRGVGSIGMRTLFPAECSACGRETRLPFKPRGDRPTYCRNASAGDARVRGGRHPPRGLS